MQTVRDICTSTSTFRSQLHTQINKPTQNTINEQLEWPTNNIVGPSAPNVELASVTMASVNCLRVFTFVQNLQTHSDSLTIRQQKEPPRMKHLCSLTMSKNDRLARIVEYRSTSLQTGREGMKNQGELVKTAERTFVLQFF